eukprot:scpid20163/ scgid6770/ 
MAVMVQGRTTTQLLHTPAALVDMRNTPILAEDVPDRCIHSCSGPRGHRANTGCSRPYPSTPVQQRVLDGTKKRSASLCADNGYICESERSVAPAAQAYFLPVSLLKRDERFLVECRRMTQLVVAMWPDLRSRVPTSTAERLQQGEPGDTNKQQPKQFAEW